MAVYRCPKCEQIVLRNAKRCPTCGLRFDLYHELVLDDGKRDSKKISRKK